MRPGLRRAAALALGAALLAAGCETAPPRAEATAGTRVPGPAEVRAAVAELSDKIVRDHSRSWPDHVTCSRDFEELPLVALSPVEVTPGTDADAALLRAALEQAVRDQRLLRLHADELAVPPTLRAGDGEPPPAPALRLASRAGPEGVVVELWDEVEGRLLLTGASR